MSRDEGLEIAVGQKEIIEKNLGDVCDEAGVSEIDGVLFWERQFLNPFSVVGFG